MSYTISNTATTNTNATTGTSAASSTSNAGSAKTLDSDFSTFLTLLTTQVQHQDPTSPMDTTQWTNQLVQYSSVEQQIKSNTYLSTIASNSGNTMSSAVNYIGKTVTASSATSALSNGSVNWTYDVGSNAAKVALKVTDSNGTVVYSGTGNTASGEHGFSWDGTTTSGTKDTGGNYTLSVTATDASGNNVTSSVGVSGTVNSVQTDSSGNLTLTLSNGTEVPVSNVTGVATAS